MTPRRACGTGALVNEWLANADDPLDPEELAERVLRLSMVIVRGRPATDAS
ncbi:hypothetical protein ACFQ7F_01190 [Streptomyces sp. NPDC056486]|uniref:hypothetical protein n=1 Tax=Streptomyces sp. NPDC056486 TaxID=3345835 RepID=UPI00369FF4A0